MCAGEDDNVYSRPVSPTETWFLVYPESVPGVIQIVIEGAGRIGHDELIRAVDTASGACPGARLTRQGMTWMDSGMAPAVRVLPGDRVDRHTFADAAELHSPLMGNDGGPTCELLLLTGEESDTLIVRAFHGVMDGQGVRTWAEDIFRVLRGEEPVGAPSRITENELIEQAGAPRERRSPLTLTGRPRSDPVRRASTTSSGAGVPSTARTPRWSPRSPAPSRRRAACAPAGSSSRSTCAGTCPVSVRPAISRTTRCTRYGATPAGSRRTSNCCPSSPPVRIWRPASTPHCPART